MAWKVLVDDSGVHYICFMFVNWSSGPSFGRYRSLQERSHALDYTLWGCKMFLAYCSKKKLFLVLTKKNVKWSKNLNSVLDTEFFTNGDGLCSMQLPFCTSGLSSC